MTITLPPWEIDRLVSGTHHILETRLFPSEPSLRAGIFIDAATGELVWGDDL